MDIVKVFTRKINLLTALLILSNPVKVHAHSVTEFLNNTVYGEVGMVESIDPALLYSISLVESAKNAGNRNIAPHKYAIRTPKGAFFPKSYDDAVSTLNYQLKIYNPKMIDVGLMQINGQHFGRVNKPEELLDPRINITVASRILKHAMDSTSNKLIGIGRYHSFTEWRARAYGARVLAVYNNLTRIR
ncbi:Transglycosylase SLT domain-containing protein [Succinivibrio dextrinosolvens]|uniref:lytic transglycosylase domain-containing protein n=1 Tax=Succinivibrio dextrinosolvens TaxID=83771 RepID=UPI0008F33E97|nr:lytic transglycosylase domain-containing protein [Succinivibrio dextrinosolvens]SFS32093.1 Transglycosylase SLT domain-containing protein [Succinivibrio dextrinosolvens]